MAIDPTEQDGSVMHTLANRQREMFKIARPVILFTTAFEDNVDGDIRITAIRFKAPTTPRGEWLAIVSARTENGKIVAFHKADDFIDVVKGVLNRACNGSLKWKEDQYG